MVSTGLKYRHGPRGRTTLRLEGSKVVPKEKKYKYIFNKIDP
jgi:hypothetical protein